MFDPSHVPSDKQAPWSATIDRSWADATSGKPGPARDVAVRWFSDAGPYFRTVCERAGLDPQTVHRRAINTLDGLPAVKRIAKPKATTKARRGRTLTHDGLTLTVRQWSVRLGICLGTIEHRLARKLPVESVLSTKSLRVPAKPKPCRPVVVKAPKQPKVRIGRQGPKPETFTLDGLTLTVAEWAKIRGLCKGTIYTRLSRGEPIERAIERRRTARGKHGQTLTHDGLTLTVKRWAKHLGIRAGTINYRLRVGHTVADALSTDKRVPALLPVRNTVTDQSHPGVGPNFGQTHRDRRGSVAQDCA